jgi:hypothetical protein
VPGVRGNLFGRSCIATVKDLPFEASLRCLYDLKESGRPRSGSLQVWRVQLRSNRPYSSPFRDYDSIVPALMVKGSVLSQSRDLWSYCPGIHDESELWAI